VITDIGLAGRVSDLPRYYAELCRIQAEAHGEDYLLVHEEIRRCLSDGCESYTELGVNQGATLAAAVLHGAKTVMGYDISLVNYWPAAPLFSKYVGHSGTELGVFAANSLEISLDPVDVLYIDTVHNFKQLSAELNLHSNKVNRYIICHDTNSSMGLRQAIKQFLTLSKWRKVNDCREGTGFTTLAR